MKKPILLLLQWLSDSEVIKSSCDHIINLRLSLFLFFKSFSVCSLLSDGFNKVWNKSKLLFKTLLFNSLKNNNSRILAM